MNNIKRLAGIVTCLLNIVLLCGCGSGGPDSVELTSNAENWDEITWDQDSWE